MFLKKYWKSNLFFMIFIFLFTLFYVYINNYPISIYKNMLNDYFWINVFLYIFIYLVFTFIVDFVIFLFNRFFN